MSLVCFHDFLKVVLMILFLQVFKNKFVVFLNVDYRLENSTMK
jgi:hypothetical protein